MFDKFHFAFTFKSKVPRDVFINENECQSTSTFSSKMSLQCHLSNSMCHFKFLRCHQLMYGIFLDKSHYMSNLQIVCVNWCAFYFCASFCVSNVKNLQKLCQPYTLREGQHPRPSPWVGGIWVESIIVALECSYGWVTWGSLHTRAKSRDHEIVRARKRVSKGRPKIPPTSCGVVTDPRV